MADVATLIDGYIAMWNETDAERRRDLVERTWTDDATYVDPLMRGDGADGIDAMIAAVQEKYPGYHFELAEGPDAHGENVRFSWHLVGEATGPVATGIDFGTLGPDGRLRSVTGFLEQPAAA
jgi:hypothetical protein